MLECRLVRLVGLAYRGQIVEHSSTGDRTGDPDKGRDAGLAE